MGSFQPQQQVRKHIAHGLIHRIHIEVATTLFIFWMLQFVGWMIMMVVAIVIPGPFTRSLLYTVEISHWALVEAAGTAAISSWALIQAKHNTRKIQEIQQQDTAGTRLEIRAAARNLELQISELAKIPPGPSADELANRIVQALKEA